MSNNSGSEETERFSDSSDWKDTVWEDVKGSNNPKTSVRMEANTVLYETYWPPLYDFARMDGKSPGDAEELLQAFLCQLVTKEGWLKNADESKGRFRNFLLKSFINFMRDDHRKLGAIIRGGHAEKIYIDKEEAERNFELCDNHNMTPEEVYESKWARTLVETATGKMKGKYLGDGNLAFFETLKSFLSLIEEPDYPGAAAKLGKNLESARVTVSRFRGEYRDFVRRELADSLAPGVDVEEEYKYLISVLLKARFPKS